MTILNVGTPLTCGHPAAIMAPSELDPPGMSDDFYHASVVTLTTNIDDARNRIAASTTEHLNQLRRKVEVDVEWMKKETEARFAQFDCEAKEARELIATLRAELTNAEKKEAMAVAEARKARAELDELRDSVQSGKEPLRAELEMWKASSRKYRKKLEHSEQALARLKARAGAAGFVEATPPHHHASAFRPHAKRVRMEETRDLAAPAPATSPPRQADPAAPESDADPSPPDVHPTLAQMTAPAVPDPGARWRRKGGGGGGTAGGPVAALAAEVSLRRANSGDSQLWGATQVRGGDARGGDAYAAEDRRIFKLGVPQTDRRPGAVTIGGDENAAGGERRGANEEGRFPARGGKERVVKFVEVVRKRSEREKLPAFTCEECDKFYAAAGLTGAFRPNGACQHRPRAPPTTGPGTALGGRRRPRRRGTGTSGSARSSPPSVSRRSTRRVESITRIDHRYLTNTRVSPLSPLDTLTSASTNVVSKLPERAPAFVVTNKTDANNGMNE